MDQHRHFTRGRQPTYACAICGRRTRRTDANGADLCEQCFALSGWDNTHNDDHTTPTPAERAVYDELLASIIKKGGNGDAVKDACPFVFPKTPA